MTKNSEITYTFTVVSTLISAAGHTAKGKVIPADSEEAAVAKAKEIADAFKDKPDVVEVTVFATMYDGIEYGLPFGIFTASSKDRVTTAYYRYLAQYALKGGLDYYAIPSKDNHRLTLKEITTGVED